MASDWKERLGVVYSTNPEFNYQREGSNEEETLPPRQQNLRVSLDRRQRKGKSVTLVTGFKGRDEDLQQLAKLLKTKCGVGGSAKNGEIIVQGDFVLKVLEILVANGYKAKRSGG
jgi:translation initiation factor 1